MTKIRKSRRGFTLLEIVIVVAIIVIVAGAAFLGVTVTLTRANAARNELIQHNGDNFEVDARNEIEHLKADPNFTPIQEYTPDGETDEDDEDDEDEDDEDDGEDEEENGGGPVNNQPGNKNSPTPTPTNTPTPTPTPTNTPTPTPTKAPSDSNYPSAFESSRPSTNGTVKTATVVGNNAPGASTSNNGNNIQASFGGNVDSFVYHLPDGAVFDNYNQGTITDLGDGYYRWTSDGQYPTNISVHTSDYSNFSSDQANDFYISEVIIHQY